MNHVTTKYSKPHDKPYKLLTSPDIMSMEKVKFSNGVCEGILTEHPTLDLTVATIYRPPDTTQDQFQELLVFLKTHLSNSPHTHLVITGDLNFPQDVVTWQATKHGTVPVPKPCHMSPKKLQLQELLQLTDDLHMHQVVNTHTRDGPPPNTLDLLFTNTPEMFHSLDTVDMSGTSDHKLVNLNTEFSINIPIDTSHNTKRTGIEAFNFERAHTDRLKEALSAKNLPKIIKDSPDPIDGKRAMEEAIIETATEANVPKHSSARSKDHSAAIKKLYKERAKVILTLRKTPLQTQAKAMRLKEQKKVMVRCSSHPVARCNRRPQAFSGNGIFLLNTSKLKHYLVKNWAGIKEEWVMGFKSESGHFFNNSNNMVESLNQKLKEVIHQ